MKTVKNQNGIRKCIYYMNVEKGALRESWLTTPTVWNQTENRVTVYHAGNPEMRQNTLNTKRKVTYAGRNTSGTGKKNIMLASFLSLLPLNLVRANRQELKSRRVTP